MQEKVRICFYLSVQIFNIFSILQFKDLEEDNASLSNQLFEVNCKLNELTHKPSGGGGVGRVSRVLFAIT